MTIYRGLNTASSVEADAFHAKVIQLSDVKDGVLHLEAVENYGIKAITREEEAEISVNFIGLRPFPGVDPYSLFAFFESPIGESYIRALRKGASLPILNVKEIQDIPILKLSAEEMEHVGLSYKKAMGAYAQALAAAEQMRIAQLEQVYDKTGLSRGYMQKK
ncbi:hypothetical protein [Paenibacillus spongiae]|uniref:Restriction endonuclease subunit S n=1 Tax=Paenibacillus spongiae TaxID=2909671 RepID=A0ABY5SAN2_9BACL|nr:hypothetical protein [Paenibacillus spongiae]UVI31006.1 hypothetical protein L1F29_03835 [Paenibacillus spongiae]